MTTIVFRGGVLVADTRAFSGSSAPIGIKRKIFRHPRTGALFGISTPRAGLADGLVNWFLEDKHPDHLPPFSGDEGWTAIEVTREGEIFYYNDRPTPSGPLTAEYVAIGSGCDQALGALALGADAETAVLVASQFDQWTNDIVTSLNLNEPDKDREGRLSSDNLTPQIVA